jgi:potassium channel subfamily K
LGKLKSANVDKDEVVAARLKAAIPGVTVAVLFVMGVLVLMSNKGLPFIDAFYRIYVTVTTLGPSDRSFNNLAGHLLVVFWILTSVVCVVQFFLYSS